MSAIDKPGLPSGDPRHGTANGYTNFGCRCDECKRGNASRYKSYRSSLRGSLPEDDPRHGTTNGYTNYACRCPPCTEANSIMCKNYKLGRKSRDA